MWRQHMPRNAEYPRYFDVLCAAVITLWLVASIAFIGGLIFNFIQNDGTFLELLVAMIATPLILVFYLVVPAFILSGVVSLPMWLICKYVFRLDRTVAAIGGGLTGLIILTGISLALPGDVSDLTFRTKEELAVQLAVLLPCMLLGAFAGWNGYRIAYNGRP